MSKVIGNIGQKNMDFKLQKKPGILMSKPVGWSEREKNTMSKLQQYFYKTASLNSVRLCKDKRNGNDVSKQIEYSPNQTSRVVI